MNDQNIYLTKLEEIMTKLSKLKFTQTCPADDLFIALKEVLALEISSNTHILESLLFVDNLYLDEGFLLDIEVMEKLLNNLNEIITNPPLLFTFLNTELTEVYRKGIDNVCTDKLEIISDLSERKNSYLKH